MRILFVSLTNDLGSDRIVGALARHGATVAVLGPRRCYAAAVRLTDRVYDLPATPLPWYAALFLRSRLKTVQRQWAPDRIVPLDELAALLLRTIATSGDRSEPLQAVLTRSLGDPAGYGPVLHRLQLMDVAGRLGLRVPAFWRETIADAGTLPFPLVVKRDGSSGGGGVTIVDTPASLATALRKGRRKVVAKRLIGQATGFGIEAAPLMLQQHIDGHLAMHTVVCEGGKVRGGVSFAAETLYPAKTGSSTVVRFIEHPEMRHTAERLVAALGCSGFVSFDFMLDRQDRAFLIELNPRPIGSTHLGQLFGHDLAAAFLDPRAPLRTGTPPAAPRAVALFPKEMARDPHSPRLTEAGVLHDVPWDEPVVLDRYAAALTRLRPAAAKAIRQSLGLDATDATAPAKRRRFRFDPAASH